MFKMVSECGSVHDFGRGARSPCNLSNYMYHNRELLALNPIIVSLLLAVLLNRTRKAMRWMGKD